MSTQSQKGSNVSNAKAVQGNASEILPGEVIRHIPLADIFCDYGWNARSKADVDGESDGVQDTTGKNHASQGGDIKQFAEGIADQGQDTPIILREVTDGKSLGGKKTDRRYEVVAGFRRFTAITLLNEPASVEAFKKAGRKTVVPNTADGTILAVVRSLDARAARVLNLRENTARNNLKTPDLVLHVRQLNKEGMNQTAIATALAITQGFVSKLLSAGRLPEKVLLHWRNGNESPLPGLSTDRVWPRVPMADLAVLADLAEKDKMSEGEVIARYVAMLNPEQPVGGGGSGPSKEDKDAQRIKDFAKMVGVLVKGGILQPGSLNWSKVIGPKKANFPVDSGTADYVKVMALCDLAAETYQATVTDVG